MKVRLSNIEDEVLNGVSGVKAGMSFLRGAPKSEELTDVLSQADSLFKSISTRTLNLISSNDTYKKQMSEWKKKHSHITNTKSLVAGLISDVEDKMNKSILVSKRSDTRRKRELEKKIVMTFYKTNKEELKKIFDLQNLFIQAKRIVEKS
jgi:hypothetical protein